MCVVEMQTRQDLSRFGSFSPYLNTVANVRICNLDVFVVENLLVGSWREIRLIPKKVVKKTYT